MDGAQGAGGKQASEVRDGGVPDGFRGSVRGPSVGVDEHDALAREILDQPQLNGIDHLLDGAAIVEGGNSHEDIHFAHSGELANKLVGEKSFLGQC